MPAEVHEAIAVKLDRMHELGPNLGNNLLPHTPEFRHVLNCPEVRGALRSLLGKPLAGNCKPCCRTLL